MSGSAVTGISGCGQHDIHLGDTSFWCYVRNPLNCTNSTASIRFEAAAWVPCGPSAQPEDHPAETPGAWRMPNAAAHGEARILSWKLGLFMLHVQPAGLQGRLNMHSWNGLPNARGAGEIKCQ